ncbi:hypothetical protein [Lentzea sp. NPDC051838]|uniref:hypothetical protein n=1 Tax=Lentzea sp. NPDC051838 TaxID=3154849 RepID=UPI00341F54C7
MRLLLRLTLVGLCAISGDHVLALLGPLVLLGCANDQLISKRGAVRGGTRRNR